MNPNDELLTLPLPKFDDLPGGSTRVSLTRHCRAAQRALRGSPTVHLNIEVRAQLHGICHLVVGQGSFAGSTVPYLSSVALLLVKSMRVLELYLTACVNRKTPPSHESIDYYLLAAVMLAFKFSGSKPINATLDSSNVLGWLALIRRSRDSDTPIIIEVETEMVTTLGSLLSLMLSPSIVECVSFLVGACRKLGDGGEELEARAWSSTVLLCYMSDVETRAFAQAAAAVVYAVETMTVSAGTSLFVRRVYSLTDGSFDLIQDYKAQIAMAARKPADELVT